MKTSYLLPLLLLALVFTFACGTVGSRSETNSNEKEVELDTILAKGSFVGKEGIETSGSYRIGRSGEDLRLVLGSEFQTESGPDLFVVLSPKGPEAATGDNVLEGAAVKVDSLGSLAGTQNYDLQDDRDLDPFDSVAIQCVTFSHLYGAAALE